MTTTVIVKAPGYAGKYVEASVVTPWGREDIELRNGQSREIVLHDPNMMLQIRELPEREG